MNAPFVPVGSDMDGAYVPDCPGSSIGRVEGICYDLHDRGADVAELADALDLGSSPKGWRFESSRPHQPVFGEGLRGA